MYCKSINGSNETGEKLPCIEILPFYSEKAAVCCIYGHSMPQALCMSKKGVNTHITLARHKQITLSFNRFLLSKADTSAKTFTRHGDNTARIISRSCIDVWNNRNQFIQT
jgi:hypothetical protein